MQKVRVHDKYVVPIPSKEDFLRWVSDRHDILIALHVGKLYDPDPSYAALVNEHLGYPDGLSVAKALRQKGFDSLKYPGHKLWLDLVARNHTTKSFALVGARAEVLAESVSRLRRSFPGIRIPVYRDGYFTPGDLSALQRDLRRERPDIVFLAMPSPRQDFLMKDLFESHPALYMGLGGSLDLYTQRLKAAPDYWERYVGWETLYRILQEPRRAKAIVPTLRFLRDYYARRL
jgi:UDP-N-acetyl-D-mannosaminouronate:lipid I N-acetyl-D-mannosaminouronosyltransferase